MVALRRSSRGSCLWWGANWAEELRFEVMHGQAPQNDHAQLEFSDRAVCNNNLPWADCLDKPCKIDAADPSKTTCFCDPVQNSGPYVVTGTSSTSACNDGKTYSSALIDDDLNITHFLSLSESVMPVRYNF